MHAVLGTVMALLHRTRSGGSGGSARGQVVDASISESVFSVMEACLTEYAMAGMDRTPSGSTISGGLLKAKAGSNPSPLLASPATMSGGLTNAQAGSNRRPLPASPATISAGLSSAYLWMPVDVLAKYINPKMGYEWHASHLEGSWHTRVEVRNCFWQPCCANCPLAKHLP
eukprot:359636-Chlamydomonas_euryale.AAC.4